jgi:hypothetical protein
MKIYTEDNWLSGNSNTCNQRRRTKRAETLDANAPVIHNRIVEHRLVIPETPAGLIGEKVTYNEKFLRKCKGEPSFPLPECGYFTITKAVLMDDGRVMVRLHPVSEHKQIMKDGTHICVGNMQKYHAFSEEKEVAL